MFWATVVSVALGSAPVGSVPISASRVPDPAAALGKPLDASESTHLAIALRQRDAEGLRALLAAQQDPGSPLFHQWLTPAGFGERFGQPEGAYSAVQQWLQAAGFRVQAYPNRIFLEATGTAAQVQALLGVELRWAGSEGHRYRTFAGTPTAPRGLAPLILTVQGLDTHPRFHHRLQLGLPPNAFDSFGPQDLRRYYDIQPLLQQGYIGSGLTTAVLGADTSSANLPTAVDIDYFYQNASDSSAQFVLDELPNPNGDLDPETGIQQELEMDAELQTVAAPGLATVTVVLPPASEIFGTGINYIANNLPDVVAVSTSFGGCETEGGLQPSDYQMAEQLLSQATSEGQTWFAASGDDGVDDCGDGSGPSADFPASIPEMVAVGGAQDENPNIFDANGAVTAYDQEQVWNDGATGGAGGGWSSIGYTKPAWQVGSTPADGDRDEPDIALLSEPDPGVVADNTLPGQLSPNGGTSDAAPLSAGIFALIGERLGGRLGGINPTLYALGRAQLDGGTKVFHDITQGNNSHDGITGATAAVGYDLTSGWGSLDVAALAGAWPLPLPNFAGDGGSDAGSDAGTDGGVQDAGPLPPYDPCAILACDGGADCETVPEGPSACVLFCNAAATQNPCGLGNICYTNGPPDAGFCTPGCYSNSDCPATQACDTCELSCIAPGNATAQVGDPCQQDSDCPTGGLCITAADGIPGGYCSAQCGAPGCGCPSGASCWSPPASIGIPPLCLAACTPGATNTCSRQGYVCQTMNDGTTACQAACQSDADCLVEAVTTCDVATGVCAVPDAGPKPVDAGPAQIDAGPAPVDAGTPTADAGTPPVSTDAGTVPDAGSSGKSSGCGCSGLPGSADWPSLGALVFALVGLKRKR
jgi:hypothetical protein